jgi:hypothetical protein
MASGCNRGVRACSRISILVELFMPGVTICSTLGTQPEGTTGLYGVGVRCSVLGYYERHLDALFRVRCAGQRRGLRCRRLEVRKTFNPGMRKVKNAPFNVSSSLSRLSVPAMSRTPSDGLFCAQATAAFFHHGAHLAKLLRDRLGAAYMAAASWVGCCWKANAVAPSSSASAQIVLRLHVTSPLCACPARRFGRASRFSVTDVQILPGCCD